MLIFAICFNRLVLSLAKTARDDEKVNSLRASLDDDIEHLHLVLNYFLTLSSARHG